MKKTINKKTIYQLAVHWGKDERTIRRWIKKNSPMLTHPESIKIMANA